MWKRSKVWLHFTNACVFPEKAFFEEELLTNLNVLCIQRFAMIYCVGFAPFTVAQEILRSS